MSRGYSGGEQRYGSEHQNSWDLWMFISLKMVLIGIDPYPYSMIIHDRRKFGGQTSDNMDR